VVAGAVAITAALAPGSGDPPTGPVDEDEVRAVLDRFAGAFTREDPVALGRTLARDAARVTPADRQDGRAAVTAAYRRQFDDNAVEAYVLDGMSYDGGGVGRAEGTYRVDRTDRPPITGRIVFSVVRERGRPRIALIAATPDA